MTYFQDRLEAAHKLVQSLADYKQEKGVVLAIPRGGVPIGHVIAKAFHFPLDLLMSKKIGHPLQPEFAIGAVSLEDHIVTEKLDVSQDYIDNEIIRIHQSLKERYKMFRGGQPPVDISGKVAIIVDDGIATGSTILSTLPMLRRKKPHKIVIAVPVAPPDTARKLRFQVDDLICLATPSPFVGVGIHYVDFGQVSDEEVKELMRDTSQMQELA
jgi:putative phosphoribosyl transferase